MGARAAVVAVVAAIVVAGCSSEESAGGGTGGAPERTGEGFCGLLSTAEVAEVIDSPGDGVLEDGDCEWTSGSAPEATFKVTDANYVTYGKSKDLGRTLEGIGDEAFYREVRISGGTRRSVWFLRGKEAFYVGVDSPEQISPDTLIATATTVAQRMAAG